jgi:hypothetical protein
MTLSILSITLIALSITILSIMPLCIGTFKKTAKRIITVSVRSLSNDTQYDKTQYDDTQHNDTLSKHNLLLR